MPVSEAYGLQGWTGRLGELRDACSAVERACIELGSEYELQSGAQRCQTSRIPPGGTRFEFRKDCRWFARKYAGVKAFKLLSCAGDAGGRAKACQTRGGMR
jgi:hypothetical protein